MTPRGAQGFFSHTDQHDVLILQVAGRKHWKVFNNPIPLPTRDQELGKHGPPLQEEDLGTPMYDVELKQGDFLYVPRGYIHSARTSNATGSMHLTVRILNAFFFKWGHFFEKSLPPTNTKNSKNYIGLPPLKELPELDLEFRYSTPLKWMDSDTRRQQIKILKQTVCNETDAKLEWRKQVRSHCVVQERWVDAFYRAKRKWRKQKNKPSKNRIAKEKLKIRKWLEKNLKFGQGAKKLRYLRQTIDDEHHNLLKKVQGIYPNGLKTPFDENQLCMAKRGIKVDSAKNMSVDEKGSPGFEKEWRFFPTNKLTTRRTNTEHMYTPHMCNVYISAMHNIYPPRIKSIYPVYIRRYRTYDRYQCRTHLVGAMADRNRPRIRLRRRFAMIETSLKPTFNNTFDVPIIQPFRQRVRNVPPNSTLH